ncbi:hypothetical protein HNY73_007610 [Argiope bruennichi]|uniref:Uncharacterized protein n=1 Tax=Argiope bruennichi TaxID=94029 RepID=A0A8T0FJH6_ARGBR|nr:hypothetical protein HNY73_007610 [Argiope bruennichi]
MVLTPAEKQKLYREHHRLNAEKEEENKRKDRERGRKRLPIKEISARAQRKYWRTAQRKCRQNKARKIAASETPCTTSDVNSGTSAKKSGRKRVLRNRSKCYITYNLMILVRR